MIFSFRQSDQQRIEVDVLWYESGLSVEYHDGNSLASQVHIRAGGFCGQIDAAIVADELAEFLDQLRPICRTLRGKADLSTRDRQVHLQMTGNGKSGIDLVGAVADQPGIGNRLHFRMQVEPSRLAESIRQLEVVTSEFPVRVA